ncbi:hypothetical protein BGZ74_002369, partial [Mortierella antarctica]
RPHRALGVFAAISCDVCKYGHHIPSRYHHAFEQDLFPAPTSTTSSEWVDDTFM